MPSTLTGSSGEHFVLYRLLRKGFIAAIAPEGAPNVDIIVTNVECDKVFSIQVKTRNDIGSDGGWHMREKHEKLIDSNLYYCFVDFGKVTADDVLPTTYIVPSKIVASVLKESGAVWLAIPGRNGRPHKSTSMRRLLPDYSKTLRTEHPFVKKYSDGWLDRYKENWESLTSIK